MRRPYRERFRLILTELGTGLAGRPDDLQEVRGARTWACARPRGFSLRILGDQSQVIKDFITDSDTVITELERNKQDVVRWSRRATPPRYGSPCQDELRGLAALPDLPGRAAPDDGAPRPPGRRADAASHRPPARRTRPEHALERIGPFSEASRPAIDSLGEAAVGNRASGRPRRSPSCASWPTTRSRSRSRCASSSRDRRSQAGHRGGPAREGHSAAGAGPDGDRGPGGFTGMEVPGTTFDYILNGRRRVSTTRAMLRASLTCRAGPHQPQHPAEDRGRPDDVRALQRLPGAEPAGHQQLRPARRRQEPAGGRPAYASGAPAARSASSAARVSPRQARFPASPTCHGRRSRCRPSSRSCSTHSLPTSSSSRSTPASSRT